MQLFLVLFKLLLVVGYIDARLIALNNHLLVWYKYKSLLSDSSLLQYQCISYNDTSQFIDVKVIHIDSISIGRQQNASQLYFVVAGLMNLTVPYMSKISVNCDNNQMNMETVFFNEAQHDMSTNHIGVTVDPHGRFAFGYTSNATLFYDLISLKHSSTSITWPCPKKFLPTAVDIMTPFLYIVGYFINASDVQGLYSKANLYLMTINFNNSKYDVNFLDVWTSDHFLNNPGRSDLLSVSVNYYNNGSNILVGIPSVDTVHLLSVNYTTSIGFRHISSKTKYRGDYSIGYGSGFAWLNQGKTLVVLSYTGSNVNPYAIFYYYDMVRNEQITDDTIELSIFPNSDQVYSRNFRQPIAYIISSLSISSTLYGCNDRGELLVIPPSLPGYYSVNYLSIEDVSIEEQIFSFIPNSAQCPPGTYKNDIGVWPCSRCKPTKTNSSILQYQSNNSISISCPQCINKTACPLESVTEINELSDIKQNGIYPESPETDIFDDVLLLYIFQTNWNFKSPFFISMIVLLIILIITGLISLLKLSKRFASKQQYLIKFMQHFDLIGEGKLWFGGLISIIILLIGIFAATFSYFYLYRYPIEKQICDDTASCDFNSFYNAKFDTSLQLLSSSLEQHEQIFGLLNSQQFTLNIELLNTLIHCGQVTLEYKEDGYFLPFSCYTNNLILYLSTKLPLRILSLKLNLFSNYTIDAIRTGLSGPDAYLTNNYLQKLNFSNIINRTNQSLSHNPVINLQLTKSINITEGLTSKDSTTYTGLWLPTFTYDVNQVFSSLNSLQSEEETILLLGISETAFFIKNNQKPIARRSEIIFHTILFIGVCIDLTFMILLILRLWFIPIIIYFIGKLFSSNSLVHRLIYDKKSSPKIAIFLEIQKLQQQIEIMSKRIDTLMKALSRIQLSIEQQIHPVVRQTTENEGTLYF